MVSAASSRFAATSPPIFIGAPDRVNRVCSDNKSRPRLALALAVRGRLYPVLQSPADPDLVTRAVVPDLDRRGRDVEHVARLADPRKPEHRVAAQLAEQDPRERVALALVAALVDPHHEAPRRAGLVVVVAVEEDRPEAAEVDVAGGAVLDQPG